MPYMQLARHVPSTDTFRQFSGPVLAGKKAVLRDQLRRSPKNVSSGLSSPSVSNQTGCEPWTVSPSVQSERPRFTAVAALGPSQTLGVEPDPSLDEGTTEKWHEWLAFATSLYPVYMLVGGLIAFWRPSAFSWFVKRGPDSYSAALGIIMLSMGFTMRIEDLLYVLTKRPVAVVFGFAAQYTIMPLLGSALCRLMGLPAEIAAGIILLSCCPGGTASNVVTYIARGDVPLSILMTICTTFAAVFITPLLTSILAGVYVPVDAISMALSTLQVVLVPVIAGACMQTFFPQVVSVITQFAPLIAVLISSLLASSVFSANIPLLVASPMKMVSILGSATSAMDPATTTQPVIVTLGIIGGVVMALHGAGFLLGYVAAKAAGFEEPQRRAVSIEVGMPNSSLGVVLATMHFASPLTAVPAAVSAMLMNIMGSGLAVVWRNMGFGSHAATTALVHDDDDGTVS